jgi:hypothetical protein
MTIEIPLKKMITYASITLGLGLAGIVYMTNRGTEDSRRLQMLDTVAKYIIPETYQSNYEINGKHVKVEEVYDPDAFSGSHRLSITVEDGKNSTKYYSEPYDLRPIFGLGGPDDDARNLESIALVNEYGYFKDYEREQIPNFTAVQECYRQLIIDIAQQKRDIEKKQETPISNLSDKLDCTK